MLSSKETRLAKWAGGSHFTSADDTTCADEGSDDPKPHSVSPTICAPSILTTATPADGPEAGCTENTTAVGWYANSTLLVLNPPSDALTSRVTTPAAWGGEMHMTSTHPMHRSKAIIDPGAESSGSWPMQSSSPPT
jgi:hypothetical protein